MLLPLLAALALRAQAAAPQPATPPRPADPSVLRDLGLGPRPPPTFAQIEAAREQADAIAAKAQAAGLFENVTATGSPALRHRASGYTCVFTLDSPINQVLLFHPPAGDSVGCNTGRGKASLSVFLDSAPPGRPAVESLMPTLVGAIVKRLPDVRPFGPVMTASGKDDAGRPLPAHKVAQLKRPSVNGEIEERLAVGYAGDWIIQQRVTEPVANNTTADLLNELNFLAAQREIVAAGRGKPAEITAGGGLTPGG